MQRLENQFDRSTLKQIRMSCQCGYETDEKLSFVKKLVASSPCMDELTNKEQAKAAGLFCINGMPYLQFPFCPCPMLAEVDRLDSVWR
jgi:hypothetical protein